MWNVKKYEPNPQHCNICNGKVILATCEELGITHKSSNTCYVCCECGAYVGTHNNGTEEAMGVLADCETRYLRKLCHDEFDKHCLTKDAVSQFYLMLGQAMEIDQPQHNCHFGYMEKEDLINALGIMKIKLKDVTLK